MATATEPDKLGMSKGISPVRVVILAGALIISVSFFSSSLHRIFFRFPP